MPNSSFLTIDLSIIDTNLKQLVRMFGNVMVMVKANAYGTDAIWLSKFLQKTQGTHIPYLGVSHVSEGLYLRESGIELPLFVISVPPYDAELAVRYDLTCAVSSIDEIEALELAAHKEGKTVDVHLHLNTGMSRFGASITSAENLYHAIKKSSHLCLEGIMTHFVGAEATDLDAISHRQIEQFKSFMSSLPELPRWIHAANSAAAVRFELPFCNLVRIGLGITGYGKCLEGSSPALSFTTRLASIGQIEKGETVGYNCSYTNQKDNARIGVIPVGYYDGLPRALSNKGYVLIRDKQAPMVGTICMDFMMIDLTEIPEAEVGDEVIIFGPGLSAELLATWAKTDVRELLVNIPSRVKRIWTNPPLIMTTGKDQDELPERLPSSAFPL